MKGSRLSLEEALASADYIPQFFGVCPYKRNKGESQFSLCWLRASYSILLALLLSGFIVYWFLYGKALIGEAFWVLFFVKIAVNCGSCVAIIASNLLTTSDMNLALDALRASGITARMHSLQFRLDFLWTMLFICLIFLDMFIYGPTSTSKYVWGYYLANLINSAFVNQFVGHLSVMKDAFHEMQEWILHPTKPKFEAAVCSFERVTTAAEHYNKAFGTQLLILVGTNFLLSTLNAFLMVTQETIGNKIMAALWCTITAANPIRIVYTIELLLQERNEFNFTLNSLLGRVHVFSCVSEEAKVKLHIYMKKELEFTARGFFSLNYGLISSMLGAVTTYLVILIQFQQ